MFTNPTLTAAQTLYRTAAITRIFHSFVYAVFIIPQPARGTAWAIHYIITFYMAIAVAVHTFDY